MAGPPAKKGTGQAADWVLDAHGIAFEMPALLVEARRVAHTVVHGTHGRRRAGPGETFWQFRNFSDSDSAALIDWRRSAASDHYFVREREWEAAHTCWFWADMSQSMEFCSKLSKTPKRDRAVVLMLALAELLAQAGERVAVIGGERPRTGAGSVRGMAEWLASDSNTISSHSLPPDAPLTQFSECVLISDFLDPVDALAERLTEIAAQNVRGHLVQVLDPAEEALPFEGRMEFSAPEEDLTLIVGRTEALRESYKARLEQHRAQLRDLARRLDWTFLVHHTDQPPQQPILALHNILSGADKGYRARGSAGPQDGAAHGGMRP